MKQFADAKGPSGILAKPRLPGIQFIKDTIAELRKVIWPSREETTRLTIMVIAVSVAIGLALGLIDTLFAFLMKTVVLQ